MSVEIHHGDCREILMVLAENSVDSVVTDPPYELGFMSKSWDKTGIASDPELWQHVLRVLKPGGYLLAFSGTRTYHRIAAAIEDAGFEIRDQIGWAYGQGFPKSHNGPWGGTALKPAWEPIVLARKPLIGTVEANWKAHGTGALNIDSCRVATNGGLNTQSDGRWPANLIHDGSDEVLAAFPDSCGQIADAKTDGSGKFSNVYSPMRYGRGDEPSANSDNKGSVGFKMKLGARRGDSGSAARFFQQCKGGHNEVWQDLDLPQENANTAEQSSSHQRQAAVSALVLAANSALPEGLHCSGLLMAPSTSATGGELKLIADGVTQTIQSIGSRFWRGSKPARAFLSLSHASDAEIQRLTDTTTITVSRWKSDGSAEPVTFSITPTNSVDGEKDCVPSMDGKRFIYCAKASKSDRNEGLDDLPDAVLARSCQAQADAARGITVDKAGGAFNKARIVKNNHPSVKPTDLMRYLCRLVTPAGGIVLDPFMGSGSTGKAARLEGFRFIGIEQDAGYVEIARCRIGAATPLDVSL